MPSLETLLRFYFITDDGPAACPPVEQVRIALQAGATLVQYRNKTFNVSDYPEVEEIRRLCRRANTPLVINDNILLAKAVAADGAHVGQDDEAPQAARLILGPRAIIGLSVSSPEEMARSNLDGCDYIGTGPVFGTQTKTDAKPALSLKGLKTMIDRSFLPVVAIGGITPQNAGACFAQGAVGVAVISCVTRAADPARAAASLAAVCGLGEHGGM